MKEIEATGLRRTYGDDVAVDGLDIAVGAGEIHAIVGLNGAGKTTLMRMLLGMVRPDAGRVSLFGVDVADAPASTWVEVGHMIESPFAYPELTVIENLTAAGRLHGIPRRHVAAATADAIARFALGRWADRRAGALSLGNRQRLGLACALIHEPRIIVLDEPSNGLDPAGVVFMRDLLRSASVDREAAILVSSHHLDELARIAHRISVIHAGRLVGSIDPTGLDLERTFFALVHDADTGDRRA